MDLILAWLAFPLALLALATGCGLAVEAVTRTRALGALLPAVGLAAIVVVGQFLTLADATAELATPAVVALAVLGLAMRLRGLRAPDPWAAGAAAAAFVAFAAPIVLSGSATFAGYIKLDDTATWMALTDRVMEHGRSLAGLEPSTYEATLAFNLADGYPIGAFLPLGVGSQLNPQDVAWLVQPYMAMLGALLALALWSLSARIGAPAPLRAVIAVLAAQPALLYGYYLWGGVKEVAAAGLIATAAAIAARALDEGLPAGLIAALAVVCAGLIGVLSPGGVVWLAPPLLLGAALAARRFGLARATSAVATAAVVTAALCAPVIAGAIDSGRIRPPTSLELDDPNAIGNLFEPLDPAQVAGVWPAGDFRLDPDSPVATHVLVVVLCLAAGATVVAAARRRAWGPVIYPVGTLVAGLALYLYGSPWVDAKALAIASPAIPFAAALGAGLLWVAGRRAVAAVLLAVVAGGIAWSNVLAYRDVNLAPRDQLAELERIGELIDGEGPTLLTEYQPYGARHFLREGDPEAVSELRRRRVELVGGGTVPKGRSTDTDRIDPAALFVYRSLVLRRSPAQSRPPSPYALAWRGDFYELWQRRAGAPPELEHVGLGEATDPAERPGCEAVRALAARHPAGRLVAAARPTVVVVQLDAASYPDRWAQPGSGHSPIPSGEGTLAAGAHLPAAGAWDVWLRGSVRSRVTTLVDGATVGSVRHELNNHGQYVRLGAARLDAGSHEVEVGFSGADVWPGSGGFAQPIGPLVLSRGGPGEATLRELPASRAQRLCGERLDWVEAR